MVYVAPGVSEPVAQAIAKRLPDLGQLTINIILDLDPEVYRLGYGTVEGLKLLQEAVVKHGGFVRSQPGLRIGMVMSDDRLAVFTPTPLMVEAGSTSSSKPNAIFLGESPVEQVAKATAADYKSLPSDAEIGRKPVTPDQVNETLEDLGRIPPKRFDLQRVQRVFSSRVQYAEVTVTGYRVAGRSVALPKDLLVADRDTQRRLKNTFKLFDNPETIEVKIDAPVITPDGDSKSIKLTYSQRILEDDRRRLTDRWLYAVAGYGMMVFREDRARFDLEIDAFAKRVEAYGNALKDFLKGRNQEALEPILGGLVDAVMKAPPSRYELEGIDLQDRGAVAERLMEDLGHAFSDLCDSVNPKVSVVHKDVSYESLSDEKFRKALTAALRRKGKESQLDVLFSEYVAAQEKTQN